MSFLVSTLEFTEKWQFYSEADEIRVSHPAFPSEPINVDNLHSTNEIFMKRAFKYYVTFLAEREGRGGGVRAFISLLHVIMLFMAGSREGVYKSVTYYVEASLLK